MRDLFIHIQLYIVAVAGLPDPMKDHALAITRFARDCLSVFHPLTRKLDVVLGPDTSDLSLRIGLHSGPVTAGVLRGDRARFQLYVYQFRLCMRFVFVENDSNLTLTMLFLLYSFIYS